jgi:hypothetical protein
MTGIKTVRLRDGTEVAAHNEGAYTYANRTQAQNRVIALVAETGEPWYIHKGFGRPFYVAKGRTCPHCNGYGSSLKEESDKCTVCHGSGVTA